MKYLWSFQEVSTLYLKMYVYIQDIFGKESNEYLIFKTVAPKHDISLKTYHEDYNRIIDILVEIIDGKGISKQGNFLSRIKEGWLIFWIGLILCTILPLTYQIGYWYGERSSALNSSTNISTQKTDQKKELNTQHINQINHIDTLRVKK